MIHIIVGSETGTTLLLAKAIAEVIESPIYSSFRHRVVIESNPELMQINCYPKDDILLICTATWGKGDIPVNIKPFYQQLIANPQPATGRRYGIICLGDSSFKSFAQAGKIMDIALSRAGFTLTGNILEVDGLMETSPLEQVKPWIHRWISLI